MKSPARPGEIIQEYMEGLDLTVSALAAHLRITRANLSRIIHGKTGISAEMALRFSDAFGTSPQVWIGMQAKYDLAKAAHKRRVRIARLAAWHGKIQRFWVPGAEKMMRLAVCWYRSRRSGD